MKRFIKAPVYTTLLAIVYGLLPNVIFAQGPGFPGAPVDTPIDGGTTLIAIAAAGYGARKLKARRSKKSCIAE